MDFLKKYAFTIFGLGLTLIGTVVQSVQEEKDRESTEELKQEIIALRKDLKGNSEEKGEEANV